MAMIMVTMVMITTAYVDHNSEDVVLFNEEFAKRKYTFRRILSFANGMN